ncbi:MAG: YHS domain-containing protein, partial [Pyrinomonadaceae bacterium]
MDKVPVGLTRSKPVESKAEIDPVCKMLVMPETAAAKYDYEGTTYYFCNPGCKEKFAADPARYLSGQSDSDGMAAAPAGEFIDPVCGMKVSPDTAAGKAEHAGETYYFCSTGCVNKFKHDPEKYLQTRRLEDLPQNAEYTCPMHPQIVQIGPGTCPICGMALEPKVVTLDDLPDTEYLDMKRRFWISALLTAPIFILAMSEMFVNFDSLLALPNGQASSFSLWIQFALATPVVLWGGLPFFQRAWASVKNISPNMFTLIAIGTGAAYLLSLAALFFPDLFPAAMRDPHTGLVPGYFEAAAVITT